MNATGQIWIVSVISKMTIVSVHDTGTLMQISQVYFRFDKYMALVLVNTSSYLDSKILLWVSLSMDALLINIKGCTLNIALWLSIKGCTLNIALWLSIKECTLNIALHLSIKGCTLNIALSLSIKRYTLEYCFELIYQRMHSWILLWAYISKDTHSCILLWVYL